MIWRSHAGRTALAPAILVLALTGCAAPTEPRAEIAASSSATASSLALLAAETSTVADQPVEYPNAAPAQISSSIVTIPPGGATARHRHLVPMYAYVMSGTVSVSYDDGTLKDISAGNAIMEAQDIWHLGRNNGSEAVRILVVNLGAKGLANTETQP